MDSRNPSSADLLGVDIQSFRNVTRGINFDVFLKLSEDNYAHVFSKNTGLDYKRLAQYAQKGIKTLYIRQSDEQAYREFISHSAEAIFLDPKSPPEKKIASLLNMTEQNIAEISSQAKLEEATAANTQKVIRSYVDLMTGAPETLTMILKLTSHGEYLYYHSIAVSIFSLFIAKASGQFNQRMLEIIGLGGFLHDIGLLQLPREISCSSTDLTQDQWVLMRSHPKLGLEMLEGVAGIPDEVRHIVYQHHEEPGGDGYPNGILNQAIYYPAKIIALADSFAALISRRPFRAAYSISEALNLLQKSPRKYDKDLVTILTSVFKREEPIRV